MQDNDRPCPKCHTKKDIEEFGYRKIGGVKMRQSYCTPCRGKPALKARTKKGGGKTKKVGARQRPTRQAKPAAVSDGPFKDVAGVVPPSRAELWKRYTEYYPNDKAASKPTGRSVAFMTKKLERRAA